MLPEGSGAHWRPRRGSQQTCQDPRYRQIAGYLVSSRVAGKRRRRPDNQQFARCYRQNNTAADLCVLSIQRSHRYIRQGKRQIGTSEEKQPTPDHPRLDRLSSAGRVHARRMTHLGRAVSSFPTWARRSFIHSFIHSSAPGQSALVWSDWAFDQVLPEFSCSCE